MQCFEQTSVMQAAMQLPVIALIELCFLSLCAYRTETCNRIMSVALSHNTKARSSQCA
jgi:hypothetical protein